MAKSKTARQSTQIANLKRSNESLHKAVATVKKVAKHEVAQTVALGAISGGVGAIVGAKLQEKVNASSFGYKSFYGIPILTVAGGVVAAFGIAKMRGKQQALIGGAGAGIAGGAYIQGAPVEQKK